MSNASPMEIVALLLGVVGAFAVFIKGIKKCKCGNLFVIERYNTEPIALTSIRTAKRNQTLDTPHTSEYVIDQQRDNEKCKSIRFTQDTTYNYKNKHQNVLDTQNKKSISNLTVDIQSKPGDRKRRRSMSPSRPEVIPRPRRSSSFSSVSHTRSLSDVSSMSNISGSPTVNSIVIPENASTSITILKPVTNMVTKKMGSDKINSLRPNIKTTQFIVKK